MHRLPSTISIPLLRVIHQLVPTLRSQNYTQKFVDWAENILRDQKPQLIHAYFGPIGWRSLTLKRRLGVPLVVTFLGDEIAPTLQPWHNGWIATSGAKPDWPQRLRELFHEADLLLAEGPFLRQKLIDLGCPPEKVLVQRIAIPVKQMSFRARPLNKGAKPIIFFAGRFVEQKGLLYALQAVKKLHDLGYCFQFRIVGDEQLTGGDYASRVYEFIRKNPMTDCVELLGSLNHKDYLKEMEHCDLFLQPSITTSNGQSEGGAPTTILEAQALGLPVISTWHCDIPNVTLPNESAVLVPERDVTALANALGLLLDSPSRWEAMGLAGRSFMEQNHDIDNAIGYLEDRYLTLLASTQNEFK